MHNEQRWNSLSDLKIAHRINMRWKIVFITNHFFILYIHNILQNQFSINSSPILILSFTYFPQKELRRFWRRISTTRRRSTCRTSSTRSTRSRICTGSPSTRRASGRSRRGSSTSWRRRSPSVYVPYSSYYNYLLQSFQILLYS